MPIPTCSTCGATYEPTRYRQHQCERCFVPGRAGRSPTTQAQTAEYDRARRELMSVFDDQETAACHWCWQPLTRDTATADHVVPVARGGTHDRSNLVLACSRCNGSKADRAAPRSAPPPRERPAERAPAPPPARPGLV